MSEVAGVLGNPVFEAVDDGHLAEFAVTERFRNGDAKTLDPVSCKKCNAPWPCAVISEARAKHRAYLLRNRGAT